MNENKTMALQPGVKLQSKDRTYEIVKVLGVGSFGITYLATATIPIGNISTTIKFAIKEYFLSDSCYRGDDGVSVNPVAEAKTLVAKRRLDFINEANRLKKICHKSRNIVSVNETFEANGTAYYVMEYLDGGNPSKCPEDKAVSIVLQIADALEKVHDEGVLHMDLRPDNIVMKTNDKHGTYPVLIDFGISLYFDSNSKSGTTLSVKGASPGYSPPEQFEKVCEFSPKYDIYALAAVLFYLCTGKNPPEGKDISGDQNQLKEVLKGIVSANVQTAILNAMKPDAKDRTPSLQKFRDDLMGIVFLPVLEAQESRIDFNKERSHHTVEVNSNIDWTVYSDVDWCTVIKKDDSIVVSVSKNNESGPRTCSVFINGMTENISQLIRIKQSGLGTVVFQDEDSWWDIHAMKVYVGIAALAIIGCIVGVCIWLKPSPESDSNTIADADQVPMSLVEPPVPDRTDVEEPSQEMEVEPQEETPPVMHEEPLQPLKEEKPLEETNDVKFARASRTNDAALMLSLAKANYAKAYYPVALNYFNEGNKAQAEIWAKKAVASNINRSQAKSLLDKINPPKPTQPTDDELFAKASTIEELKTLADKGYAKAYAPLAEKYFSHRNFQQSNVYVRKALSANVGREKAISVIKKLKVIGFYDNGENGGEPNY